MYFIATFYYKNQLINSTQVTKSIDSLHGDPACRTKFNDLMILEAIKIVWHIKTD